MKKLVSSIVIVMSGLVATATMAAPHEQHHNQSANSQKNNAKKANKWRVGQSMDKQYRQSRYAVDYRSHKNLSKPGKNQKWYKVDGEYVLVNELTSAILRVVL